MSAATSLWLLLDPTTLSLFSLATCTIIFAIKRQSKYDSDVRNSGIEDDGVTVLESKNAWTIPLCASAFLLVCFFFLSSSLHFILACLVSFSATHSLAFAIEPVITSKLQRRLPGPHSYTIQMPFTTPATFSSCEAFSMLVAISTVILWASTGHWILNNILGIALCITAICFLRFPSLKVATLILSALFIYDIFWVFFSKPVFGSSVMVTVAKSLDLPVKLVVPRGSSFSMLGLGDIVLPGLLIAYANRFDSLLSSASSASLFYSFRAIKSQSYYHVSLVGYALGLVMSYLAVILSQHPQPALLYLVPSTLGSLFAFSYLRNGNAEVAAIWFGSSLSEFPRLNHSSGQNVGVQEDDDVRLMISTSSAQDEFE